MNVFALGASRNIGYHSAIRLLEKGATVTFLLRSPGVFDTDTTIQRYLQSGHARLVQGDALNIEDVANGWEKALEVPSRHVDLVLFTVGGTPSFSITRGAVIDPADLCTRALLNVLRALPSSHRTPTTQPKIIAISSTGITQSSKERMPIIMRILYSVLLRQPHEDKLGMERVVAHCAGWAWRDKEPQYDVLPRHWRSVENTPQEGALKRMLLVRGAMFTDGKCMGDVQQTGDKTPYRVSEGDLKNNGYTISREDVAHFLVEGALKDWDRLIATNEYSLALAESPTWTSRSSQRYHNGEKDGRFDCDELKELLERILTLVLAPRVSVWATSSPVSSRTTEAHRGLSRSLSVPFKTSQKHGPNQHVPTPRLPVPGYAPLLVCTDFRRIGLPIFYSQLPLSSPAQVRLVQHTLGANPAFSLNIRSIRLEGVWGCALDLLQTVLVAQKSTQLHRLESFDFCIDAHAIAPAHPESDLALFCNALVLLPQFGTVRRLTVRKANNVYLNFAGPASLFDVLGEAIEKWTCLETVNVAFRLPYGPPVTTARLVAAHAQLHPPLHAPSQAPLGQDAGSQVPQSQTSRGHIRTKAYTRFVRALCCAPNLKTVHTLVPAVWNTQLLEISQNPSLQALVVTPSPSAAGASLYFSAAKRHARLYELIEAGSSLSDTQPNRSACPTAAVTVNHSGSAKAQTHGGPRISDSHIKAPAVSSAPKRLSPSVTCSFPPVTSGSQSTRPTGQVSHPTRVVSGANSNNSAPREESPASKARQQRSNKNARKRAKAARRISVI
ncbi:hypothetical protein EIP86_005428 [Pleurotus ostreatoroseus]|nr:hypothetical protein EIP86_005428 [Pleurotus ostreatoroseus]